MAVSHVGYLAINISCLRLDESGLVLAELRMLYLNEYLRVTNETVLISNPLPFFG